MKTLTSSFCPVCANAIQNILEKYNPEKLSPNLPAASQIFSSREYVIEFNYKNKELSQKNVYVYPSQSPDYIKYSSGYTMKIKSASDELLYSSNFDIQNIEFPFFTSGSIRSEPFVTQNLNYTLKAPYYPDAKTLEVYNPAGDMIAIVDLSYFSDTCGNNNCESYENSLSCPGDCNTQEDNACIPKKDSICDSNCKSGEDPDCKIQFWRYVLIILAACIVLAGIILIILKRKK
jgi:hypothetical protein